MTEPNSALVSKVKLLLHELEVGEDFTVDDAVRQVKAALDNIEVTPDAAYGRVLDLCLRAQALLRNVTGDQTQEWTASKDYWVETLSAELLLATRDEI